MIFTNRSEVKDSNSEVILSINMLSNSKTESFLIKVKIHFSIKHFFIKIKSKPLSEAKRLCSFSKESKHEVTGVPQIDKCKFKFVLIIMVDNKIVDSFAADLDKKYFRLSMPTTYGRFTLDRCPTV